MEAITLDFTGCKSLLQLHRIFKETFEFPDFYGENLYALWDCLRDYCPDDCTIYVKGVTTLPKDFGAYMEKIYGIFKRVETEGEKIRFVMVS